MKWSAIPFETLYRSIESGEFDFDLFKEVLPDLQNLNLNTDKLKNNASRSQLEKGEIELSDGSTFKVNQEFIFEAISLSDELNFLIYSNGEIFKAASSAFSTFSYSISSDSLSLLSKLFTL